MLFILCCVCTLYTCFMHWSMMLEDLMFPRVDRRMDLDMKILSRAACLVYRSSSLAQLGFHVILLWSSLNKSVFSFTKKVIERESRRVNLVSAERWYSTEEQMASKSMVLSGSYMCGWLSMASDMLMEAGVRDEQILRIKTRFSTFDVFDCKSC